MLFHIAVDLAELSLFIVCGYALLAAGARHRPAPWGTRLRQRRLAVAGLLMLAAGAIKLIEDVVTNESGPVDEAVLWFIRSHLPRGWNGFFLAVTLSGSALFLMPVAVAAVAALLAARRRFEAVLVAASLLTATAVVWVVKAIVGRARPALWEAQWYAGSSFPSGHTLSTAALATAAALCVARIWPRASAPATALAVLWTGLVAASRLVLGVHWPSDVLAAMCMGAFIALLISVAFDRSH